MGQRVGFGANSRFFFLFSFSHLELYVSSFKNLDQPLQFISLSYLIPIFFITIFYFE